MGFSCARFWNASLLAGAALAAFSAPALAADKKQPPPAQPDPRIGVLEQELRDIELQLAQIKGAHTDQPDYSAAVVDLKRSTSDQYADLNSQLAAQTKVSLANGRLSFASAPMATSPWRCAAWCSSTMAILRKVRTRQRGPEQRLQFPPRPARYPGHRLARLVLQFHLRFRRQRHREEAATSITPISQYDGLKPFAMSRGRDGALRRHRGFHRLRRSSVPGTRRPRSTSPATSPARPAAKASTIFAQGDNYLVSVGLYRQEGHRRRHLRRPGGGGRPRLLAGLVSQPDVKWLLDAALHPCFPSAGCRGQHQHLQRLQLLQRAGTGGGFHQDRQHRQYRCQQGRRNSAFESAAEYAGFYGQGGWFHYEIDRRTALPSPHFSRLVWHS